MTNNIAVSIKVDVADLQVKRAIMSSELKAAQKDLADFAKQAKSGGLTDELRADMLKTGSEVARLSNGVKSFDSQLKVVTGGLGGVHSGMAGVTRESIVMARELARGNFTRLSGSATILAQRLGILTPAVIGTGAAIAAIAAPIAVFLLAAEQGSEEMAKFRNAMEATNGYAGVTISQLQGMAQATANWAHEGIGAATTELMALASTGQFTGQTIQLIGADATRMSQLTGESADKWNAEFEKMSGGVAKFAADYQAKYGQLTTAQFEYIQQLEQQGQKESAEYALAKDVYNYLGQQAPQNLGFLESAWHKVGAAISDAWDKLKGFGRDSNADKIAAAQSQLDYYKNLSKGGGGLEHSYDAQIAAAERQLALARSQEAADERSATAKAHATEVQKEGVAAAQKLQEQFDASRSSGEKLKIALQGINENLNRAVAADPANKALYEQEAAGARAQAMKSDAAPKGPKGPGVVQQYQEEFRRAQVLSNDFFGDETQKELAFWQSKASTVANGSKDWLEIQGHIYDAAKALAHEGYQSQLASLNDALQADRDNWAKEQADWNVKLAFIKSTFGQESAEYKNAYREMEAAAHDHAAKMDEATKKGRDDALKGLESNLAAQKSVRDAQGRSAETTIQAGAKGDPILGEVSAAQKIAALHAQENAQDLADAQALNAAKMAILDQAMADAAAKYTQDSEQYRAAAGQKKLADQEWANQQRVMSAQATNAQIQDQQRIASAWHSSIDPLIQGAGSQIKGLVEGTETWQQAIVRIGEDALQMVISAIERMVEQWIVSLIMGKSAQSATAAAQVASYAGIAGAAGVASMAGAPWPLDMTAPAFGASMASAAMAFGTVASLAVGTNEVPTDMMAQIHAGERIIPAADNKALMSAVGASGGGRRGGDLHQHINYAPQLSGETMPFRDQLRNHASDVTDMVKVAVRSGALVLA